MSGSIEIDNHEAKDKKLVMPNGIGGAGSASMGRADPEDGLRPLGELEEALHHVRQVEAAVRRPRRRYKIRSDSLYVNLKERGLLGKVGERFEEGWTLEEIRAWLRRDYGIETSVASISRMRWHWFARKVPKSWLEAIERYEAMCRPLVNYLIMLQRLDARYATHVEMERRLGVPMHEIGLAVLRELRETNARLVELMVKYNLIEEPPDKVDVKGNIEYRPSEEFQSLVELTAEALTAWYHKEKEKAAAMDVPTPLLPEQRSDGIAHGQNQQDPTHENGGRSRRGGRRRRSSGNADNSKDAGVPPL